MIFTREPEPGKTKTRLMPYFSADQCAELHRCFLKDLACEARRAGADIIIAHTGGEPVFLRKTFGRKAKYVSQRGEDLGRKMENAFCDVFEMGYERVVLTGTDIPELKAETIASAMEMLDSFDVVLGPTTDGGYYLVGMDEMHHEAFHVSLYGTATVYEETAGAIRAAGLGVGEADKYSDIDEREDISALRKRLRENSAAAGRHTKKFLTENLRISVIIPVFNESSTIGSLTEQLMPYRREAEIIFVDGGSTDDTVERAGRSFTVLRSDKNRGRQLNAGAKASTGDVLFFLHCDSILPERFTDEIRRVMSSNDWGFFRIRFPSRNFFMLTNRFFSNFRASHGRLPFGDQGIFIDRDLFFEAGMFPEIPLMEDYEFSMGMRRRSGAKGPGAAAKMITTSDRRYGRGTVSILRTELHMWKLRMLYRHGTDPVILQRRYDDIRSRNDHKKLYNAGKDLTETRNNTRLLKKSFGDITDRLEKLPGRKTVQKAFRDAVIDESRRRDVWERTQEETKRLAAGRPVWVIKCPTQEMWLKKDIPFKNDYGYCLTLKKYLEREGICTVLQTYEDWYCDAGADVELLMGSLHDYHPDRRVSGRINVMWLVCHPERAPEEVLDRYDLILADSGPLAETLKGRTMARVEPFIVTADTDIFYRERSPVAYERVFIGNTRGINRDCVKWCSENKIELDVWGGGWEKYYGDDPYIHLHGYVSYEDTADIYRRARIIINDHHPEMRKTGMINNRCCEVLLCGKTMLCDWSQGVEDEFGDLMTYYHDETDFIEALERAESDYGRLCSEIDRRYEELVDKYSHASGIRRLISVVDSARE